MNSFLVVSVPLLERRSLSLARRNFWPRKKLGRTKPERGHNSYGTGSTLIYHAPLRLLRSPLYQVQYFTIRLSETRISASPWIETESSAFYVQVPRQFEEPKNHEFEKEKKKKEKEKASTRARAGWILQPDTTEPRGIIVLRGKSSHERHFVLFDREGILLLSFTPTVSL